jgi:preprotein translocase subunit SecE
MGVRISPPVHRKNMDKLKIFIQDSFDEVKNKISWPTFAELQSSAVLVLAGSLVFALVVGVIDFVFEKGMTWFYQSF